MANAVEKHFGLVKEAIIDVENASIPSYLDENGDVWVALRPIVNALGLDWGTQRKKLKNLKEKGIALKATPLKDVNGKTQEMLTINLYDLPVYLYSININKVRPELREKIKKFQIETTHAIREYWKNKIKKEREEIEKLKAEYNQLVQELRQIPTYEEYKELKLKYDLLTSILDVLMIDMEKAKPYIDMMFKRIEWVKNGVKVGDKLVKF
ncbi:antirepressor protein [Hydrogenivirga sp. 128-5-R1-1]|uniref:antirepressor protein n=2 Tax=Hydrogenivirga sp. 128-5-R1-1 TaxID=392423 RepID=UPI00015F276D|nr:antirepressor protein [Hydrogenivirga sp. 128-5-R1-1]EDP73566.1 antirepressor protein [Hydrogenivirga sp. 128-5-R1-1]